MLDFPQAELHVTIFMELSVGFTVQQEEQFDLTDEGEIKNCLGVYFNKMKMVYLNLGNHF